MPELRRFAPNVPIVLVGTKLGILILYWKFAKVPMILNLFSKVRSKLQMRLQCWLKTVDYHVTQVANKVAYMVSHRIFGKNNSNLGIFEKNPIIFN